MSLQGTRWWSNGDLQRRFAAEFDALLECRGQRFGGFYPCVDDGAAVEAFTEVLQMHGARSLIVAARPELESVTGRLERTRAVETITRVDPAAELAAQEFARFDAALGGADLAIGESGSLVLIESAEEPRALSLMAPVHLVLLSALCLVPRMADAIAKLDRRRPEHPDRRPALTFVTGPSRTADIEKTLVIPAHGPSHLYVALVP